ncbi:MULTISPECIES: winged helix-turn-helix domain-containing protein [Aeromicrobium]|uniref:winged helix-turn-helix domain-containing protein n=1 Tax=Aeromicrobium TaxID=2040 RepID=UPI00257F4A05|nr:MULTISPECIES: crosslink repair DNA glycosylase YcaQ family protein [Aeromicrobium]
MTPRLSALQARRIALAAQGFTRSQPAEVRREHVARTAQRLGFFQIDSVNVLQRAHYLPLYSRLGPYDTELLHRAAGRAPRLLFEYWAHEASLVDVDLWPAMSHKMRSGRGMWGAMARTADENPDLIDQVESAVAQWGPITARELEARLGAQERDRTHWGWNWSQTKQALEYLFFVGRVSSARRNAAFEREYDLPERVLPARVLALPEPADEEAHLTLVGHAARALGVATVQCLRDYFRLAPVPTAAAVSTLVAAGTLEPVTIDGWKRPAYLHAEAARPRRVEARTLLSPFDPLVFERTRTEHLFDFRYRIEIYVPAERRVHGYYVLPFLLGDRLVARVDLKADRARGRLLVPGAFAEPDAPDSTAAELAQELHRLAGWLGLEGVEVGERGDLAHTLATECARPH